MTFVLHGQEGIIEDVIAHSPAQKNALGLVEGPVDAKVNSALAVLFFGLAKCRETTRKEWAYATIVVPRHSVEFVGYEGERDLVGPVKSTQRLKERAAESRMAGRIGRERRCEVRTLEVAGRRAQRRPD